jgi:hypothetical protein
MARLDISAQQSYVAGHANRPDVQATTGGTTAAGDSSMKGQRKLPKGMVAREKGRILVQVYDRRVGKRIGKTFDRRELAAAKSWKRDTEQAIEKGLLRAGECPTFREASAEFMRGAAEGSIRGRSGERFKPSTLRGYEFALRKTLLPRLGSLRLNEIRPGRLAELIGGPHSGNGRSRLPE